MADERDSINAAFETCLQSYLSKEAREKIREHYGAAVAARVQAIYDDALGCPVDWRSATIDTALPVLHKFLDNKYPWLSSKARSQIVGAFIMEWK